MQRRTLGRSGVELSIAGLGGCTLMNRPQEEVDRDVAFAVDSGVDYFDVSPTYGNAEELLGPALAPYRDKAFLACKTNCRGAAEAKAELENSLRTLRTDHFDLYQFHALSSEDEARAALGDGGAIETLLDAKARGLTRLIGFSAHNEAAAMLAIESGHFDSMLIPLNFGSYRNGNFARSALAAARERGMGILALKAMARQNIPSGQPRTHVGCWYRPEDEPHYAELLLRWTLSLEGLTAALPPGNPELWRMGIELAGRFEPLDDAGLAELEERYASVPPLFTTA